MTNDAKDAFLFYSVDGNWSDWKDWSDCPVTCGGGVQNRSRTCTNPPAQFGGKPCPGESDETRVCNEDPCPGKFLLIMIHFSLDTTAIVPKTT